MLLADVFESFRYMALRDHCLDPCHFYSLPGLAWNAMLKMTGVELELLVDINQHLFVASGVRGGVAMISNRHAIANNPLIPDPVSYTHLDVYKRQAIDNSLLVIYKFIPA